MSAKPFFTCEALESRQMLDGNVSAVVVDGDLFITGDPSANRIRLDADGLEDGEVRVQSDDTSVNNEFGQQIFTGVTRDIRISLRGGDDQLEVRRLSVARDLRIFTRQGADQVTLIGTNVSRRLHVETRGDDDVVNVLDCSILGRSRFRSGGSNDLIMLEDSTFGGRVDVAAGSGDDSVARADCVFSNGIDIDAGSGEDTTDPPLAFQFDFDRGRQGWRAGFGDTFEDRREDVRFRDDIVSLPNELGEDGRGYRLIGTNLTDDLFMYLKRRLDQSDGIEPGQTYQVSYQITFASNATADCAGVGGSPGGSVFLKAGATPTNPKPVEAEESPGGMNVDIGDQGNGGPAASVTGDIDNGQPCGEEPQFVSIVRRHIHTSHVRADENGRLFLLVGTDSGFEGRSRLIYQRIEVSLVPTRD